MKYGFIGIGNMGHFMAGHCLKAGYKVVISNTHAKEAVKKLSEMGAEEVNSNAEIGRQAERVFLCLPNGDVVKSVIDELITVQGSVVKEIYDFSTVGPMISQELGADGKERGYKYYDCPIAGGVAGAEAGTLSIMIGCDDDEFEKVKEVDLILVFIMMM